MEEWEDIFNHKTPNTLKEERTVAVLPDLFLEDYPKLFIRNIWRPS